VCVGYVKLQFYVSYSQISPAEVTYDRTDDGVHFRTLKLFVDLVLTPLSGRKHVGPGARTKGPLEGGTPTTPPPQGSLC